MTKNFADSLLDAIDEKQNPSCAGLDPVLSEFPPHLLQEVLDEYRKEHDFDKLDYFQRRELLRQASSEAIYRFNVAIIDAIADVVGVVKPNIAFYEKFVAPGINAFERTIRYAKSKGLLVIDDSKRTDIGKTSQAYAQGHLGQVELIDGSRDVGFDADAMTVGVYPGSDSVGEFIKVANEFGKGIFVLDKTSNPSSGELQDLIYSDQFGGRTTYEQVALLVDNWGRELKGERGYSFVGATYPEQAQRCREMMGDAIILVPGYGGQGGTADDTMPNFNKDGYGATVNNSSALTYAWKKDPILREKYGPHGFAQAAREAALLMRDDILSAMERHDKLPSGW